MSNTTQDLTHLELVEDEGAARQRMRSRAIAGARQASFAQRHQATARVNADALRHNTPIQYLGSPSTALATRASCTWRRC